MIRKLVSSNTKGLDGEVEAEQEPNNLQFSLLLGKVDSMTPRYQFKLMGPVIKGGQEGLWVGCIMKEISTRQSPGMISCH